VSDFPLNGWGGAEQVRPAGGFVSSGCQPARRRNSKPAWRLNVSGPTFS